MSNFKIRKEKGGNQEQKKGQQPESKSRKH
jgi:hypothetical protein